MRYTSPRLLTYFTLTAREGGCIVTLRPSGKEVERVEHRTNVEFVERSTASLTLTSRTGLTRKQLPQSPAPYNTQQY